MLSKSGKDSVASSPSSTSSNISDNFSKFANKIIKTLQKKEDDRLKQNNSFVDFKRKELEEKAHDRIKKSGNSKLLQLQLESERAEIERIKADAMADTLRRKLILSEQEQLIKQMKKSHKNLDESSIATLNDSKSVIDSIRVNRMK